MQTVTASDIKKNSSILQNALKEDMLVTRHERPFVVIVDYERYRQLTAPRSTNEHDSWIDEAFGTLPADEADTLLRDIYTSRVDKDTSL